MHADHFRITILYHYNYYCGRMMVYLTFATTCPFKLRRLHDLNCSREGRYLCARVSVCVYVCVIICQHCQLKMLLPVGHVMEVLNDMALRDTNAYFSSRGIQAGV